MPHRPQILFLYPQKDGDFVYHLGASYIIAYLKEKGIYARQFITKADLGLDAMISSILEHGAQVLGFTVYDDNYFLVKELSVLIKQRTPQVKILAGGPTATFSAKRIMQDSPQLDVCVQAEGEVTTYELINSISLAKDLKDIRGITYRDNAKIITTPTRPLLKEGPHGASLDILPSPYLNGVLGIEQLVKVNRSRLPIITSRGCYYKCIYCNFSAMSRHTVRFHSAQRVIAELKILDEARKSGLKFEVQLCDDAFALDRKRVEEICQGIINEKIDLCLVGVELRADKVDRKFMELLFKAGVREINFGLESASPRVLYNVKKVRFDSCRANSLGPEKLFLKKLRQEVKNAKEIGFKTSVSVIFGLPGDNRKSALKTIKFIRNLNIDGYAHNTLSIYAGTALARNYRRYGIRKTRRFSSSFLSDPILSSLSFSYNVEKIPHIKNKSSSYAERRDALSWLTSSVSGIYKNAKDNLYPKIVFVERGSFPVSWLKDQGAFQTRFIYGKGLDLSSKMISLSVGFNTAYLNPKYSLLTANELLKYIPEYLKMHFSLAPLKNYSACAQGKKIIFLVRDSRDIYELQRLSLDKNIKYDLGFKGRLKQDFLILDACRWSSGCPAKSLYRLILDANSFIKPCFDACAIGKVGDNLDDLRNRFSKIHDDKARQRGCAFCPARYGCSKCPFLGPGMEDKYCNIMKNNPGVGYFINSFQLARKIDFTDALRI